MFSIIMPVWNRADMVKGAIESVLAQSFKDYELIIINYGSEDNSKEAIEPYLCEKVTYHHIACKGLSAARNFGFGKSKYSFIAYIDSDHLWHAGFLATMYSVLKNPDTSYELAYCIADD